MITTFELYDSRLRVLHERPDLRGFFPFSVYRRKLFPESVIRNISFQILQGLSFIHKHGRCVALSTWVASRCKIPSCGINGQSIHGIWTFTGWNRLEIDHWGGILWLMKSPPPLGFTYLFPISTKLVGGSFWQTSSNTKNKQTKTTIQVFVRSGLCFHISSLHVPFLTLDSVSCLVFLPFSVFGLVLERIRCSQRMNLGTSCFKC